MFAVAASRLCHLCRFFCGLTPAAMCCRRFATPNCATSKSVRLRGSPSLTLRVRIGRLFRATPLAASAQFGHFLPEPTEDSVFGLPDGFDGHLQVSGNISSPVFFHSRPPERAPGVLFEFCLQDFQCPLYETGLRFGLHEFASLLFRDIRQQRCVAAARLRLGGTCSTELSELVPGNAPQPCSNPLPPSGR